MTLKSTRRARLLRLRTIEHRVAKTTLATADEAVANLARVNARLALVRLGLAAEKGFNTGQALLANAEMAARLARAAHAMVAPVTDADAKRAECAALRIKAHQNEQGALKLYEAARRQEDAVRTLRADANRAHQKRITFLEHVT